MSIRPDEPFADKIADIPPLDVDGVRSMMVGTALWGVAALALLPFWGTLRNNGNLWWLWTVIAGVGLGLLGLEYCLRRARKRGNPERNVERTVGRTPVAKPAESATRTHHHSALQRETPEPDDTVIIRPAGGRRRANRPESAPDDTVIIRQPGGRRRKE